MKIRFLKDCEAPQAWTRTNCECCGPMPQPARMTSFVKDEEADPTEFWHEIDLSGLQYRVDYDIIEYP